MTEGEGLQLKSCVVAHNCQQKEKNEKNKIKQTIDNFLIQKIKQRLKLYIGSLLPNRQPRSSFQQKVF